MKTPIKKKSDCGCTKKKKVVTDNKKPVFKGGRFE